MHARGCLWASLHTFELSALLPSLLTLLNLPCPDSTPPLQASAAAGIKLPICLFPLPCVYLAPVIISFTCGVPVVTALTQVGGLAAALPCFRPAGTEATSERWCCCEVTWGVTAVSSHLAPLLLWLCLLLLSRPACLPSLPPRLPAVQRATQGDHHLWRCPAAGQA